MPATVVVGLQWGDEGKGKTTDLLAESVDLVVRYQGGDNAGHTVVLGDEVFKLHLVPSGVLHPHITPVIGNGVVVNPRTLIDEMAMLALHMRAEMLRHPGIELQLGERVVDLVRDQERVVGVMTAKGPLLASVVLACDGLHAHLEMDELRDLIGADSLACELAAALLQPPPPFEHPPTKEKKPTIDGG